MKRYSMDKKKCKRIQQTACGEVLFSTVGGPLWHMDQRRKRGKTRRVSTGEDTPRRSGVTHITRKTASQGAQAWWWLRTSSCSRTGMMDLMSQQPASGGRRSCCMVKR